ncbi:hypothetical protein AJ80_07532 [Polytolypa hystricis UAMH7299]|uniref:Uncharacterized protein n=1 Tax=Polytolypa hystricis (strain UAMH7299) TaxID=1447883 RepID=A0A2B7XPF8_POLH7|nr:hypothetical protein AJ80_07532 [Polytolypa hystricis UAMH7299]
MAFGKERKIASPEKSLDESRVSLATGSQQLTPNHNILQLNDDHNVGGWGSQCARQSELVTVG